MSIDDLLSLVLQHKWLAIAAVIVGAVVRCVKGDSPLPFVPAKYRPWLALGLGMLASALDKLVHGGSLGSALLDGVIVGGLPILGHDLGIESIRGGKEIPLPKVPVALLPFLLVLGLSGCAAFQKDVKTVHDILTEACDIVGDKPETKQEIAVLAARKGISMTDAYNHWHGLCMANGLLGVSGSVGALRDVK